MATEIEQFERIQEYLRNNLSNEERAAFERDLETDNTLLRQYKELTMLSRTVKKANQEADLRKALAEYEKQLSDEPRRSSVAQFFNSFAQWFRPTNNTGVFSLSYPSRMAISFAVAASLALAIILPYNASIASSGFNYAPSRLELQIYRGGSSDLLEKAVNSYNNEDYNAAVSYLDEAKISVESAISKLGDSDEDAIARLDLTNDLYRIEYYRAYSLMKEKRVREAKRALQAISKSGSPFAKEALDILHNVY